MTEQTRRTHATTQGQYFDQRAANFLQPIPESIQGRTRSIVSAAALTPESKVLDVGTGCGVLIEHFLEAGIPQINIVGCDLSSAMLRNARTRFPEIFFFHGDILDFSLADGPADLPSHIGGFDAIFYNACFGNLFDQKKVLVHSKTMLADGGKIVISHPLGGAFVAKLRASEPEIVPHLLPSLEQCETWANELNMQVLQFDDRENFYLAILARRD